MEYIAQLFIIWANGNDLPNCHNKLSLSLIKDNYLNKFYYNAVTCLLVFTSSFP